MTDEPKSGGGISVAVGIILVLISVLLLNGCTMIRFNAETKEIRYLSVLQKKSLDVSRSEGGVVSIRYSTDSDAAVKLAELNVQLAQKLAAMGAAP